MRLGPYRKYKPSGSQWLGPVPEQWDVKRGRFRMKVNPPSKRLPQLDPDDDVSFVPMKSVGERGRLVLEQVRAISDVGTGYTVFDEGDILVAKITPCFENGKGARASGLVNGVAFGTTELHVLRATRGLDPGFLFYFTTSQLFRDVGEGEMYGAGGQKRVPVDFLKNVQVPLPGIEEQRAIVGFLDGQSAKIDTLVAKKRTLIERLEEKRTVLISRVVRRGLPPDAARSAGLEPAPRLKPSGVDWLGEVPEDWEIDRVKWSTTGIVNGIWGDDPNGDNDLICVRVADFDRERLVVVDEPSTFRAVGCSQRKNRLLHKGDLLIEKSGGGEKQLVGCVVFFNHGFDAVCSNFVARMPVSAGQVPRYWAYVHAAIYFGKLNLPAIKQTTGIQNLDSVAYLDTRVSYPPSEEQRSIAAFLDRETAKIDRLVDKVEIAIERLQEYRAALVTAAVTGKIDVRGPAF